ncbi:ribonuclease H-like domain-containing protein [Pyronema omphalodes]|nr:ribonuclease H-like domain-containing protein [Pyronema omphalodes]
MPPPSRANNVYGPPFPQQGAMHVGHSFDRYQQHINPQHQHPHQAQIYQQQVSAAARSLQEKSLLSILNQNAQSTVNRIHGGGVSAAGLGGVVTRNIGVADPRQQASMAAALGRSSTEHDNVIRDVWADNLEREMEVLRGLVEAYPYIAMDTEFPGIVARPIGKFPSKADYHYQTLRCNVDMLKIIQLGITLANENGELAKVDGQVSTWQFNFRFSLEDDMYAQDSIDLLTKSGIDFARHSNNGIDVYKFGELLITSGMVLLDEVKWISFHSGYDFGYLVKIMSCESLPKEEANFRTKLRTFFPSLYDIKFLMKSCRNLKGGLQDIADEMGIQRIGPQHQAGSDSLLTGTIFFRMRSQYFENKIDDSVFLGQVWGLNGNGQSQQPNGVPLDPDAQIDGTGAPQPPKTPVQNGSETQGTPDNTSTPMRNATPGTPGYTPSFGRMGA